MYLYNRILRVVAETYVSHEKGHFKREVVYPSTKPEHSQSEALRVIHAGKKSTMTRSVVYTFINTSIGLYSDLAVLRKSFIPSGNST